MNKSEPEIWKAHPDIDKIEVSSFGRVRSLKGHYYTSSPYTGGYLRVSFRMNGKRVHKSVHRLVAQTFIKNTDSLSEVNHKDGDRANNNVSNLEWCSHSYNQKYREKYGVSQAEAAGHPLFAINLSTLKVSRFGSQSEADRALGISNRNINSVIKGRIKQAGGYYFKEDDGNGIEIDKNKLNDIVDGMRFRGGVFAVNLYTLEVSRFNSQREAGRALGIYQASINKVINGKHKQTHGFYFVNDDNNAANTVRQKLHDIGKTGLKLNA